MIATLRAIFADPPDTVSECADDLWHVLADMGHDATGNECRRIVAYVRHWQPALARQGF